MAGKGTGTLIIVFLVGMVAGHFVMPKIMGMLGGLGSSMGSQAEYARAMAARRFY